MLSAKLRRQGWPASIPALIVTDDPEEAWQCLLDLGLELPEKT